MAANPPARFQIFVQMTGMPSLRSGSTLHPVLRQVLRGANEASSVDLSLVLPEDPSQEDVVALMALIAEDFDVEHLPSIEIMGPVEGHEKQREAHIFIASDLGRRELEEQMRAVADALSNIEERPLRLLVLAQHLSSWGALEPIATAAQSRTDIRCTVAALEGPFNNMADEVFDTLARDGFKPVRAATLLGKMHHFDAVVLNDPYDGYRPDGFRITDFVASGCRVILSPYAENLGGLSYIPSQYNTPTHNAAWRIYVSSQAQVDLFDQYCDAGAGHTRFVGSIKKSWLVRRATSSAAQAVHIRKQLGTDRVVLWNPHFRVEPGGRSTFLLYVDQILSYVEKHGDVGLIVRPHPLLLRGVQQLGGGPAALVSLFRRRCAEAPNVILDEERDYGPSFAASSVFLSDLSSLIPEYLGVGRAVGYLEQPGAEATSSDETWLDQVSVLRNLSDVISFLQACPEKPVTVEGDTWVSLAGARAVSDIFNCWSAERLTLRGRLQE